MFIKKIFYIVEISLMLIDIKGLHKNKQIKLLNTRLIETLDIQISTFAQIQHSTSD